ncbi:unnamed protein product [Trichogramma brassicae]|uniref:Reverse transcriptase domain-containing protein n=1 Tax=Trichogramma brassicae TaxID=86971 RepID=A0A6H5ISZ3_9HYME|nr:unnamed protein product [Trichogramma brassicae]
MCCNARVNPALSRERENDENRQREARRARGTTSRRQQRARGRSRADNRCERDARLLVHVRARTVATTYDSTVPGGVFLEPDGSAQSYSYPCIIAIEYEVRTASQKLRDLAVLRARAHRWGIYRDSPHITLESVHLFIKNASIVNNNKRTYRHRQVPASSARGDQDQQASVLEAALRRGRQRSLGQTIQSCHVAPRMPAGQAAQLPSPGAWRGGGSVSTGAEQARPAAAASSGGAYTGRYLGGTQRSSIEDQGALRARPGWHTQLGAQDRYCCMTRHLPAAGKILERIICDRLEAFTERPGGLSERQYGFRKGRSTIDAIEDIVSTARYTVAGRRWHRGTKKYCAVVTLDVRNAFNSARWDNILAALRRLPVPDYLLRIIASYFSARVLDFTTDDGPES